MKRWPLVLLFLCEIVLVAVLLTPKDRTLLHIILLTQIFFVLTLATYHFRSEGPVEENKSPRYMFMTLLLLGLCLLPFGLVSSTWQDQASWIELARVMISQHPDALIMVGVVISIYATLSRVLLREAVE